MSSISAGPGRGRYIIRSKHDDTPLTELLGELGNDPAVAMVDAIGPPGKPHTVVCEMTGDKARSLQQRFDQSNQFIIEPDRPLSMFQ